MWSSLLARAAWLSWADLSDATRACVGALVVDEADRVMTLEPYYYAVPGTGVVRPGNTGADEDSWMALAPAVAVAMMPQAERRDAWRAAEVRFLAASWARAQDLTEDPVVDGVRLDALVQGWNVLADGSIVNHDRIAPDYSTNAYQNVDAILVASLAGQQAPQASLVGLAAVYRALGTATYSTADGYLAPGGTVYTPGSASVYYPQGCDWGTGQQIPYALLDTEADLLGLGGPPGSVTDAAAAAGLHLAASAQMQARSDDGRMYAAPEEYTYVGREEHAAQLASQLVLALVVGSTSTGLAVGPADVAAVRPDGLRAPPPASDGSHLASAP
jgi:hypothetical protein